MLRQLWLTWWWRRLRQRRQVFARRNVGNVRQTGALTASGIVNANAIVVEQSAHSAFEFDTRFFVSRHCRHQGGFSGSECAAGLQNGRGGRRTELIFLLLGIERLLRVILRSFGRGH